MVKKSNFQKSECRAKSFHRLGVRYHQMVSRANYRWRDLGTRLKMCSTINVLDRRRFRNLRRRHASTLITNCCYNSYFLYDFL